MDQLFRMAERRRKKSLVNLIFNIFHSSFAPSPRNFWSKMRNFILNHWRSNYWRSGTIQLLNWITINLLQLFSKHFSKVSENVDKVFNIRFSFNKANGPPMYKKALFYVLSSESSCSNFGHWWWLVLFCCFILRTNFRISTEFRSWIEVLNFLPNFCSSLSSGWTFSHDLSSTEACGCRRSDLEEEESQAYKFKLAKVCD